jgi:hypothetical protein
MPMQDGTGPRGAGRGQGRGQGQGRGRGPCGGGRRAMAGQGFGRLGRSEPGVSAAARPLSEEIAQLRVRLEQLERGVLSESAR